MKGIKRTEIRFVSISAKFGICTVVFLNGTLVEAAIQYVLGTLECACLKALTDHFGGGSRVVSFDPYS